MIVVFLLFFLFYNYTRLLNSFIPFVGGGGGGGVRPVEFRSLMGPDKLVWSIDGSADGQNETPSLCQCPSWVLAPLSAASYITAEFLLCLISMPVVAFYAGVRP